jgi:hypothetical protein
VTIDRSRLFDINPGDLDSAGGIALGAQSLTVVGQALNAGAQTVGIGRGRTGLITVVARDVRVADGTISSSVIGSGSAPAGDITIHADRVGLESSGMIVAPMPPEVTPRTEGGAITVIANDSLTLRGGSLIASSTAGQGDAGPVVIRAGRLEVAAAPGFPSSSVATTTFRGGDAGSHVIEAGEIVVDNGSISAGTAEGSTGSGGNLRLSADHLVVSNVGSINANTLGAGNGGRIAIRASDEVEVTSGATIGALTSDTYDCDRDAAPAPG